MKKMIGVVEVNKVYYLVDQMSTHVFLAPFAQGFEFSFIFDVFVVSSWTNKNQYVLTIWYRPYQSLKVYVLYTYKL